MALFVFNGERWGEQFGIRVEDHGGQLVALEFDYVAHRNLHTNIQHVCVYQGVIFADHS